MLINLLDTAFTERILGSPSENFKGYVEADATQRARYIPNHALFLIHGLADLSVPYTHGVALARSLAEAGILFKYHVCNYFPHSIARTLRLAIFSSLMQPSFTISNERTGILLFLTRRC
jgi:dipeptidyl aminopeptidase/acylaminoacyl peptidase